MAEQYSTQVVTPRGPLEAGCQLFDSLKTVVFTAINSHHGSCLRKASLSLYSLQSMRLTETIVIYNKMFLRNLQNNSSYHCLKSGEKTSKRVLTKEDIYMESR